MRSVRLPLALFFLTVVSTGTLRGDPSLPPEAPLAQTGDPVFVGAGDITNCGRTEDEATAQLLDGIPGTVYTLGDNAYPDGTSAQFTDCYGPTWGRHKDRTRPAAGNHDYHVTGAAGYYTYFGSAASPLDTNCASNCKGYYSYDLGAWHIIALNSEISYGAGSEQEQWLRADLAANQSTCTLAYWHKPRFSSGQHGNNTGSQAVWQALYDYGADVVLNGHDHLYERFAPQNPSAQSDPTRGIREFVVGTGGASLYSFPTIQPNSEVRENTTWGVLKLTLHATSYDWEFVPIAGQTFSDTGSSNCVGVSAATATPSTVPSNTATPTITNTAAPVTATASWTATPVNTNTPTPTRTSTPLATATRTPTRTSTALATATRTPTRTATAAPAAEVVYLSSTSGGTAGGVSFANEDILAFQASNGSWSMYFDGSDVGLGGNDVDAFEALSDGTLLLSFSASDFSLAGFGIVDDSDILLFTPTSLGPTTAGSFSWFFDGSDVGLTTTGEDVDAIGLAPNGALLISVRGSFGGNGASGGDEDLFTFSGTTGAATSGTFGLYFDGSDVGLNSSAAEDVNGVWVEPSTGKIYLTTVGSFSVSGVSGDGSDIFVCTPLSTGATTSCTFGPGLYWDGSASGFAGEVTDALDIAR
jgi:hypothetical protein